MKDMRIRSLQRQRPDTAADIAARQLHRLAAERAYQETMARFAPLTPESAKDAIAWQEARISELLTQA